jgi:hypothetical protein
MNKRMKRPYRVILPIIALLLVLTTSCLKDAPEELPNRIEWDPAIAVPLGDDQFGMNHVSGFDTTKLNLDTITGVPEWVYELRVVMEGTLDFGLSSIHDNLDQIKGVLFRVSCQNGFPEEIFTQATFEDDAGNAIDSMFLVGPMAVPPGNVGENGELLAPGEAVQDSYFSKERILPLENATTILLKAYFEPNIPDPSLIPYYPEFEFNVHMGAMFDLTLEF